MMDWLRSNVQTVLVAIRAVMYALIGFQVFNVTIEQLTLLLTAVEAVFAAITAKTSISNTRIDTIVDKRVIDILKTPEEVIAEGPKPSRAPTGTSLKTSGDSP